MILINLATLGKLALLIYLEVKIQMMKIHLEILMKWSSCKMWCEGHIFLVECHIFPPPGTTAQPFGVLPLTGTGSAPQSQPAVASAPLRTKDKTFGRFAPHKSVFCENLASLTRCTKPKTKPTPYTKACLMKMASLTLRTKEDECGAQVRHK